MTTSAKVKKAIRDQGRKKNWLAHKLEVSRPYLDKRLADNFWSDGEVGKLKLLGLVD